jgi:glycosyltransferase involved in cell wall biosynthesis
MTKLSILIPTTPDRHEFMRNLFSQFIFQRGEVKYIGTIPLTPNRERGHITRHEDGDGVVEFITFEDDKKLSIGHKRNALLSAAQGEYLAFIDSDDRIGDNYFAHAFTGINQGVDACGLTGIITEDGQNPKKFVHSMRYDSWYEKDGIYYRNNNHLNVCRSSIAKQMRFPETSQGEDHDYSKQLLASGLIKTEYWDENEVIYMYDYRSKK